MRIGLLTSHRCPCGVSEYSARFADALAKIDGVEPVILAGRADEHRSVPEDSPHEVHDTTTIGLWRDDGLYSLDSECVRGLRLDVLHVQYQSMLFTREILDDLFHGGPRYMGAVTFHDNCQRPDFPYHYFDLHFSHRWNVGPGHLPTFESLPFPIESRPPVVRSFGLGRTRDDLVAPICQRNGWVFESAASHEPIHGGGQAWRTHDELIAWLRGADALVLWYDDNGMAGSSQGARTAMASRRPVFTNDVKWFEDLPPRVKGYEKVQDLDALEERLRQLFRREYADENSWDKLARIFVDRYERVLQRRAAAA